jgi:hypothetical protein
MSRGSRTGTLKARIMRHARTLRHARDRKPKAIIDGYDHIEIASIDSFPASDPPGWIEGAAHPYTEDDSPAGRASEKPVGKARRGAR